MAEQAQNDTARLQEMAVVRMMLTERVIAFHPVIAQITKDVKATLFLCQLMYWSDKGLDERGWIWKTRGEWQSETSMTRREQESARAKLRALDLIEEHQRGMNRVLYYRVQWPTLHKRLIALSERYDSAPSSGRESALSKSPTPPDVYKETKTTTETTTDIYVDEEFPWLGILRTIPGWAERGEPLVTPLVAWAKEKGHSPEYLHDHAIGVSQQGAKGLKGTANLARKFQNACNAAYYTRRNGSGPDVTDDERLDRIRKAKSA